LGKKSDFLGKHLIFNHTIDFFSKGFCKISKISAKTKKK
jgi:hypothetical protein